VLLEFDKVSSFGKLLIQKTIWHFGENISTKNENIKQAKFTKKLFVLFIF